jgi:hypothetical protein
VAAMQAGKATRSLKFERLGFIDYKHGLKVNDSLLTVVLHD